MSNCRICGGQASEFLDLGMQPFANKYPKNKSEIDAETKHEMIVEFCVECKSAQISSIIDREMMFNDYYYLSSVNRELVQHFNELAGEELKDCQFVLDVGSNDGILLRPLKEKNIKCLGIDPSVNVGKLANDEDLETIIGFLDDNSVKNVKDNYGIPDAIVASSVFTHIEDPTVFIDKLRSLCGRDTSVYVEIEYLGNLIKNLQFERFYFDRPHYYSIKGMQSMFSKGGLKLTSIKEITPHGGSLRLKFNLDAHAIPEHPSINYFLEKEQKLLSAEIIDNFSNVVRAEAQKLIAMLEELKIKGKNVIGYGSPARLATITNFCNIDENLIPVVFEDSPLKIGSYTPGQHIPIKGSQELETTDFDCIIVFAYEYIKSIKEKTDKYNVPHYKPIPLTEIG